MFDKYHDIMLLGPFDQVLVMLEELGCRLGDENMNASLDGIQRNRVMCTCQEVDYF
jgi:hypothetical protein